MDSSRDDAPKAIPHMTIPQDIANGLLDGYKTSMRSLMDVEVLSPEDAPKPSVKLDGRRVLMVAPDAVTGDRVQEALEAAGLTVQRADAEGNLRTEDADGQPMLPRGEVVIVDGGSLEAMQAVQLARTARAVDAIVTTFDRSMQGSLVDHAMLVSPEDAMIDAMRVLNAMLDRMTEAGMVRRFGGWDKVPDHVAQFLNWMPRAEAERRGLKPAGTNTVHSTLEGGWPTHCDFRHFREGGMQPSDLAGDPAYFTEGLHDEMRLSDARLDSLFGDEVIARERRMRSTYVLSDERSMMRELTMVACKAALPETGGFDYRTHNEQFNIRRGRQGRGTPGKRRGGRK